MLQFAALGKGINRNVKRKGPLVPHNHVRGFHSRSRCKQCHVHIYWGRLSLLCLSIVAVPLLVFILRHCAGQSQGQSQGQGQSQSTSEKGTTQPINYFSYTQTILLNWSSLSNYKVDRRSSLSVEEFCHHYDGKWPVLVIDVISEWKANKKWTKDNLVRSYGQNLVNVKNSPTGNLKDAVGQRLTMLDFFTASRATSTSDWMYLEDEQFILSHDLKDDIGHMVYNEGDLFELFPDDLRPWNAMLLWGTAGSRSSLHVDPYNWTGINAVLWGHKRWKLYPPGQDALLNITKHDKSGFPLNSLRYSCNYDAFNYSRSEYPRVSEAEVIEFDQLPGELLIIPPGWLHQAFNAEETLAVSSQMMNSENYLIVLEEIFRGNNKLSRTLPEIWPSLAPSKRVKTIVDVLRSEQQPKHSL